MEKVGLSRRYPRGTWAFTRRPPSASPTSIDVLLNSSGRVTFNPPLESALDQRRGHETRHRLREADAAPGARPHQHLLRRRQPLGRGVGGRGAGRLLPAPRGADGTRFSVEQEIADSAQARRASASCADDAQVLAALRQQARDRLREENRDPDDEEALEAGGRARAQELDPVRDDQAGVERAGDVGLAQHLHVHEEHGRPAGGARRPASCARSCGRPSSRARSRSRSGAGTRASRRRRRWSTWRSRGRTCCRCRRS